MARGQPQQVEFNSFAGGLNTEASYLNFPADSTLDEINFEIQKDGSRRRRKGLEQEAGGALNNSPLNPYSDTDLVMQTFLWQNAGKSKSNLSIVRIGHILHIYDANTVNPSANPINTITLNSSTKDNMYSFANINGYCVIATGSQLLTILAETGTVSKFVSVSYFKLSTRDVWGIDQGDDPGERSPIFDARTIYNLLNSGWPERAITFDDRDGNYASYKDLLRGIRNLIGVYPARNDVHYAIKGVAAAASEAIGAYNPWLLLSTFFGSSDPIRGRFIIDPFTRGPSRVDNMDDAYYDWDFTSYYGLDDTTSGGVSKLATYAGRVFYALTVTDEAGLDDSSPNLAQMVFFSPSNISVKDMGKCYAKNDPTVEDLNSPLATDGGFITISGMGEVVAMREVGNSLFIFANNGVWEVNGGESAFSATNVNVSKTSNVGAISDSTTIFVEDGVIYWANGGIYALKIDPVSLRGSVTNISENKIQSFYLDIPYTYREQGTGVYLNGSRQVRWLYSDSSTPHKNMYNKELIFDLRFNSFTTFEFSASESNLEPYVFSYMPVSDITLSTFLDNVVVITDPVYADGQQVVVSKDAIGSNLAGGIQYATVQRDLITLTNSYHTVHELSNEDFLDWFDVDGVGVDAAGYMLTGALTGGDTSRKKQTIWLTTHMELTDSLLEVSGDSAVSVYPSSCYVQGQWEWTTSKDTGRWSNKQQIYRLNRFKPASILDNSIDYGYSLVTCRTKIRGSGRALSLYFITEPGKDCHIYGWSLSMTANNSI